MSEQVELGLRYGHLKSWPSWVLGNSSVLRQHYSSLIFSGEHRDLGGWETLVQDRAGISVSWFSHSPFFKHYLLFLWGVDIESDMHARGVKPMFGKGSQLRTKKSKLELGLT